MTTKANNRMIDGASVNVLDFGADPSGNVDSTAAIQNAIDTGNKVVFETGTYLVSGVITVTVEVDLRSSIISQQDLTSDTILLQFGGSIVNGKILTNNSTGVGVNIDGSTEFFIGRDYTDIIDNIVITGNLTNQSVSQSRGVGLQFTANQAGAIHYISGVSVQCDIAYFTTGLRMVSATSCFINSNFVRANINRCGTMVSCESATELKNYNIGQNIFELNLQPGTDTIDIMNLACSHSTFRGNLWDLGGIASTETAINLIENSPAVPWANYKCCVDNVIDMFGAHSDRATGTLNGVVNGSVVDQNTVVSGNNESNIKQPFARTDYRSNKMWRKVQNGVDGVFDTLNYVQTVDNAIANANKRFLTVPIRTNQGGANLGGVAPEAGFSEDSMFIANSEVTRYELGNDWFQQTISFIEGENPAGSHILTDMVGIKLLAPVRDIIVEVREAGQSSWTEVYNSVGSFNKRELMLRMNPFGGSTNQIRPVALSGVRIRFFDPAQVYEIENIFIMSPDSLGTDMVNANNAMITTGNLWMADNQGQGIVLKSDNGNRYKLIVQGTALVVEPYTP